MDEVKTYIIELDGKEMLRTDNTLEAVKAFKAWRKRGTVQVFHSTVWDVTSIFEE